MVQYGTSRCTIIISAPLKPRHYGAIEVFYYYYVATAGDVASTDIRVHQKYKVFYKFLCVFLVCVLLPILSF